MLYNNYLLYLQELHVHCRFVAQCQYSIYVHRLCQRRGHCISNIVVISLCTECVHWYTYSLHLQCSCPLLGLLNFYIETGHVAPRLPSLSVCNIETALATNFGRKVMHTHSQC